MKIDVAYVHPQQPRAVLHSARDGYVVVQSRRHTDIGAGDVIAGDPMLANVKWLLNITRRLLIDIRMLGHYPTLAAAIDSATRPQCGSPVSRHFSTHARATAVPARSGQ